MGESNRVRDVQIKRSRRVFLPYLILLVGLCFTIIVYYYFSKLTFEQDQSRFQKTIQGVQDRIKVKIETSVALLRAASGLFAASDDVSLGEFNHFVEQFDLAENYPGIQGIGYAVVFRPDEKDKIVKRLRAEGDNDFHVWPDSSRDQYTSVIYLQPSDDRNQRAIGYDMFTDAARREGMERARETGKPASSARVRARKRPRRNCCGPKPLSVKPTSVRYSSMNDCWKGFRVWPRYSAPRAS